MSYNIFVYMHIELLAYILSLQDIAYAIAIQAKSAVQNFVCKKNNEQLPPKNRH